LVPVLTLQDLVLLGFKPKVSGRSLSYQRLEIIGSPVLGNKDFCHRLIHR
jgi:hypothetical protein